jgi:hypothetical protein
MKQWYSKELGDGMLAYEPSEQIISVFQTLFAAAGNPAEMAVFTRHESEGRLHCEVVAYFSPAAAEVARMVDAAPCAKPERTDLGLLAGGESSWNLLFPNEGH